MEENCSIKLFESDLESMLSQVLAKARSRDEKLKAAKEKAVELKHQNEKLNAVLDLEKPSALTEEECELLIQYLLAENNVVRKQCCIGRIPHLLYARADGRNGNQKNCRVKGYIAAWFYKKSGDYIYHGKVEKDRVK